MGGLALQVAIVGFAGYRLGRAIAVDDVTARFRAFVYERAYSDVPEGMALKKALRHGRELRPPRLWVWIYGLVSCPLCCGFWITLALWFVWLQTWSITVALGALAATGVQCFLTMRDS